MMPTNRSSRPLPCLNALILLKSIPQWRGVRPLWHDLVVQRDVQGEERINRINYELCVLETMRDRVRCREIWVVGADK
jgi:hypothetical protein